MMKGALPTAEDIQRIAGMKPSKKFKQDPWVAAKADASQIAYLKEIVTDHSETFFTYANHVERERILSQHPFRLNRVSTWVLVPSGETDGFDIRCSVNVTTNKFLLALPNQPVQTIDSFYLNSAATPLHYRNQGYANHLLLQLFHIYQQQDDFYIAAAWYSLAGRLYAKFKTAVTISLNCTLTSSFSALEVNELSNVEYFRQDETENIVRQDRELLKIDCEKLAKVQNKPVIAVLPDAQCLEYKFRKGLLALNMAIDAPTEPLEDWNIAGAYIKSESGELSAFAIWRLCPDLINRKDLYLYIIRLRFQDSHQLRQLITAAKLMSERWGCHGNVKFETDCRHRSVIEQLQLSYVESTEDTNASMSVLKQAGQPGNIDHELYTVERYMASN